MDCLACAYLLELGITPEQAKINGVVVLDVKQAMREFVTQLRTLSDNVEETIANSVDQLGTLVQLEMVFRQVAAMCFENANDLHQQFVVLRFERSRLN